MVVSQSQVSDSISFIFLGCVGHWFWPQPTVDVVESILYICVPWLDFSDRNIFQHCVLFLKRFLLTKILQIRLEFSLTSHPLYIVVCPSTSLTSYIFSTAQCPRCWLGIALNRTRSDQSQIVGFVVWFTKRFVLMCSSQSKEEKN